MCAAKELSRSDCISQMAKKLGKSSPVISTAIGECYPGLSDGDDYSSVSADVLLDWINNHRVWCRVIDAAAEVESGEVQTRDDELDY